MDNTFYCLIVGSRSYSDYSEFKRIVDYLLSNKENIIIVSGGANGADSLAKLYATEKGYEFLEFPADWNTYGKRAGYIRNEQMHEYIAKYAQRGCIAFWDGQSTGTTHNFSLAKKYKNPIRVFNVVNKQFLNL